MTWTQTVCLQGDAADESLIKSLCERALTEHGYLSCFFANAGIVTASMLNMMESADVEETLRVNTISVFLACKYASDAMKRSRVPEGHSSTGSIILTASVAGIRSGAGPVDYSCVFSQSSFLLEQGLLTWQYTEPVRLRSSQWRTRQHGNSADLGYDAMPSARV
jgi:NAD(P)-dependent dehydrogenase (short-subunit alcohol dehydrogenase family)